MRASSRRLGVAMHLGKHFTLAELTVSQYATRHGIDNDPNAEETLALRALVANILDPLRIRLARPVVVSSGYRAPRVNAAIGGSPTSQHVRGEAADIIVPGMSSKNVCRAIIAAGLPFDQLIQEFGRWTHVSYKLHGRQRGEILTAKLVDGRTRYLGGLV